MSEVCVWVCCLLPTVARSDFFLPHGCIECGEAFASVQARGLHRRKTHEYMHPIRRMVWGSLCPICHVEFHSRPIFVQHLAYDGKSCREVFVDGEPFELSTDFIRQLDTIDVKVARANRRPGLPETQAVVPVMTVVPTLLSV